MLIARKLKADHPDDWDECDMTEAVALLAEAGITGEDSASGVRLGSCARPPAP